MVQKDRSAVLQDPEKEPSAARTESLEPQGDIADMPSKFTKESGSKGDADHKGLGSGFKSSFKLNEEESHSESIRQPESSKSDSKSLASESNTNYPEEIQDALNRAQKFVSTTTATFCRDCGQKLLSKFDPIEVYQSWHREGKIDTMSSVICSGTLCQAKVCIGCGKKPKANNPRNSSKFRGETLGWCCEKGRAFAIWVMLCRYDMLEIDLQQSGSQAASVSRGTANPNTGTGYARMSSLTIVAPRRYEISQPLNFKQMDNYTDNLTQEIIGLMLALLPKPGTKAEQEAIAIASMLELSLLQDRVGQLLRNDSIRNVSQRAKLYFEAFEFVQLLAEHENFDYLVTDDRFIKKKSAGLFELTNPFKKESTFQTALVIGNQSEGKASSLLSCMSNLATQSSVFLGLKTGEAREDHTEMAKLIVKIQKSLSPEKASGHQAATWKDYHKDNCFVSKKDVLEQLRYDSKDFAQKIRNPHKYRMGRISSEIAELVTSLPEGIFVIGDEVRIDVMKALIVGPQGTPYEGGLFEYETRQHKDKPSF